MVIVISAYTICYIYILLLQLGHLSSNGICFDIGKTTILALTRYKQHSFSKPYLASTSDKAAGNGCIMRLCPVPLTFWLHPAAAIELSADSARSTHGAQAAEDAARWVRGFMTGSHLRSIHRVYFVNQ